MSYKIIFFDVDGTLVDNETKQIPESTVRSIHALHKQGVIVVAATGRSYGLSRHLKEQLHIEHFITFSGGLAQAGEAEIFRHTLPRPLLQKLRNHSPHGKDALVFFGKDTAYSNGLSPHIALPILKKIDCDEFPPLMTSSDTEDIFGACLFLDRGDIRTYQKQVPHVQFYQWGEDIPNAYNIEIKGTNKANGVRSFLHHFGIDPSEAMAFGDGGNDKDMLQSVGLGIAMGNAREELKKVASFTTKPVNEDGISFALAHFSIIKKERTVY